MKRTELPLRVQDMIQELVREHGLVFLGYVNLATCQLPIGCSPTSAEEEEPLVSLAEAAKFVRRSKRTLEKYRAKMPAPWILGTGSKPNLWIWKSLRPWLERTFPTRS